MGPVTCLRSSRLLSVNRYEETIALNDQFFIYQEPFLIGLEFGPSANFSNGLLRMLEVVVVRSEESLLVTRSVNFLNMPQDIGSSAGV